MAKRTISMIAVFMLLLFQAASARASESESEAAFLRAELQAMREELDSMRRAYDDKIENMQAKIDRLEGARPRDVAPQEPTPLPGLGRPALDLPDISVIGNVVGTYGGSRDNPDRDKIVVREVELALQGYLHPDVRADVMAAFDRHDGHYDFELEEAYITFLRIPYLQEVPYLDGFSVQAGKKLLGFGKLNPIHPHHWHFVDRPWVLESYLGDHGLAGTGVNVSYLAPLPFFLQADFGAWHVDDDDHHGGCGHDHSVLGLEGETYSGRLWSSFPLSDSQELEAGFSGVKSYGSHRDDHKDKVMVFGADLTYRLLGDALQRLILQSEILYMNRKVPVGTLHRWGGYGHLNYRFNQYWDAGFRYDWLQTPFPSKDQKQALSGMLTHSLTETTKLRLQYQYDPEENDHGIFIQAIFGLGPHAHPLE